MLLDHLEAVCNVGLSHFCDACMQSWEMLRNPADSWWILQEWFQYTQAAKRVLPFYVWHDHVAWHDNETWFNYET